MLNKKKTITIDKEVLNWFEERNYKISKIVNKLLKDFKEQEQLGDKNGN